MSDHLRRLIKEWRDRYMAEKARADKLQAQLDKIERNVQQDRVGKMPRDPQRTTRKAAAKVKSGTQRWEVLELLRAAGPDGMTNDELCRRTGLPPQSITARVNELVNDDKLVVDSGDERETQWGKSAIVWIHVEHSPDQGRTSSWSTTLTNELI